jgi:hypothetical protein
MARDEDDLVVSQEDIRAYLDAHPEPAGLDVALLIGAEKARKARPDLSPQDFAMLSRPAVNRLSGYARVALEILAAVDAVRPPRQPPHASGRPQLTEPDVRDKLLNALHTLARNGIRQPTRLQIADQVGVSERSLYNWLARFPNLRKLLP